MKLHHLGGLVAVTASVAVAATMTGVVGGATAAPTAAPTAGGVHRAATSCTQPGPNQLPHGSQPVHLDPADFSTHIDNPYWPMPVGTVWHYRETGPGPTSRVTVKVTHRTRVLNGVRARVVHDFNKVHGRLIEDTRDFYAQDSGGSLWYLGEQTKVFDAHGHADTTGSWLYGVGGGQAGVIVPANPATGCRWREEFHQPDAKDRAIALSTKETVKGPTGLYRHVLHTSNSTPVEPGALENKFYARGVGPVIEMDISPASEFGRALLVRVTH